MFREGGQNMGIVRRVPRGAIDGDRMKEGEVLGERRRSFSSLPEERKISGAH